MAPPTIVQNGIVTRSNGVFILKIFSINVAGNEYTGNKNHNPNIRTKRIAKTGIRLKSSAPARMYLSFSSPSAP